MPPGPARRQACEAVVKKMFNDFDGKNHKVEVALAWVEANAATKQNRRLIASHYVYYDPTKTFEIAGPHFLAGKGYTREGSELRMAMRDYAFDHWDVAVELTLKSPSHAIRSVGVAGLVSALPWGEGKSLKSLETLSTIINQARLESKPLPDDESWAMNITEDEVPNVMNWLGQQTDQVQAALLRAVLNLASGRTEVPIHQLLLQFPPSAARAELLITEVRALAGASPRDAADFSLTLPPGTERDFSVLNTVIAWSRTDPAAAKAWMNALPDSPSKARALQELR